MTLTVSTFVQNISSYDTVLSSWAMQQIGSTDQTVMYAGDTPMQVALPEVDGGTSGVAAGWTVTFDVQAAGALEVVDRLGHRVALIPGYSQAALVATNNVAGAGESTYGGWTNAMGIPNLPIEHTTALSVLTYGSLSSDATPSVLRADELDIQSTVTITYLDGGVLGQEVTLKKSQGTNTTHVLITHAASFALLGGENWDMSTGEELVMKMVSTDGWAETGRRIDNAHPLWTPGAVEVTSASVLNADDGNLFDMKNCASLSTGILGGAVGQTIHCWTTGSGGGFIHSTAVNNVNLSCANDYTFGTNGHITLFMDDTGVWRQADAPTS